MLESLSERRQIVALRRQDQDAQRAMRLPLTAPSEDVVLEEEQGAALAFVGGRPPAASAPIAIAGNMRHYSMRDNASPMSDVSPSSRILEQRLASSGPALPLGSPPHLSPLSRKAAFCGSCGNPFNSESQRFCTACGAMRFGAENSPS